MQKQTATPGSNGRPPWPAYFERVEPIWLRDPLAEFLGALPPDTAIPYRFEDAVKVAGHCCPAVAGAWLVTARALAALYPGSLPVRGEVRVDILGGPGDLAYGPQAQVIAAITGAAGETGFHGLAGKWARNDLLRFHPDKLEIGVYVFKRTDTGAAVEVRYDPDIVPPAPEMSPYLRKVLSGAGSSEDAAAFGRLWQERVERILTGTDSFPGLVMVRPLLPSDPEARL